MAEVTRSPELFLGKRRSSMDCDAEVENPAQITKRYRVVPKNSSGFDSLRHEEESEAQAFKRNRSGNVMGENQMGFAQGGQNDHHIEQYHQSVIASLKMEHQMALSRKDQEISRLQQEIQMLQSRCQAMAVEHHASIEENRVLKRGVAIQDNRYRELSASHEQLQQVMSMAVEHIAKLEQANRDLTSMVNSSGHFGGGGGPGGFPHGPPPDVY